MEIYCNIYNNIKIHLHFRSIDKDMNHFYGLQRGKGSCELPGLGN